MKQIYKKVYGIDLETGLIQYPFKLSLQKQYILDNCGWHIIWRHCYCPLCNGPRKIKRNQRNWKHYRNNQWKWMKDE